VILRPRWATVARWALVALALGVLWNTLRHAELARAAGLVASIGPRIVLVLVPWLLAMVFQAAGYARILAVLHRSTSFPRLVSVLVSAEAVLMSFPAGQALAESLNPYLLKRRCGVPVPEGLAAVAAKKALIVLANGLYMGVAVVAGGEWLASASRALIGAPGLPWIVAAAAAVVLATALVMARVLFSGSVAARSYGLLGRIPSARLRRWLATQEHGFTETDQHFAALSRAGAGAIVAATAAFLGCWLVEGSEALVILRLLRVDVSYAEVLAFEVVVVLLRSLAFMVPAGLGVQDAGYVAFFGAFGVPDAPTLGVAFVIVKRAKELAWIAVGYLLFVVLRDVPSGATEANAGAGRNAVR
jgi:glycosyltransferase 2 family protein